MAYLAGDPQLTTARQLVEGAATLGQSSIGVPGGFTPGMVDVAVGGAVLSFGDYDDSDGMTVKLTNPMSAGTQYRVVGWSPGMTGFPSTANYIQKSGDTMKGQLGLASQGLLFSDGTVQTAAPASNRNYVVDGAMNFVYPSQSNAVTTTGAYTQLCMYFGSSGTGGAAVCQQALSGVGVLPIACNDSANNVLQWAQSTASSGSMATKDAANISQRIENVRTLQGRSATFSMWLSNYGANPITIPGIVVRQNFGSGGSPSPTVIADKTINWVVPVGGWYKYSARIDFPSIMGMSVGTNGNDFIAIGLWFPSVVFNLNMTQWQLEQCGPGASNDLTGAGGSPTAFEWRGWPMEGQRVARQLQWSFIVQYGTQGNASDTYRNWYIQFQTPMRNTPSVSMNVTGTSPGAAPGINGFSANANPGNTTSSYPMTSWFADARF